MIPALLALMLSASNPSASDTAYVAPDLTPIHCDNCEEWNRDQAPFRIVGDTYYVGTHGLSSVLIKTGKGLILLDGDLPQSVPLIAAHIKALGFDVHDVRWILNSHAHFDHAGGIAALQRISGANVGASTLGALALQSGMVPEDDPQYDGGKATRFAPVQHVSALFDGETVVLGDVTVTVHYTPGHTPGGTTWTWRSCEDDRCYGVVYADSLNAVQSGAYRFSDPARHPTTVEILRHSIELVRWMPCDVVVSVHPDATRVLEKAAANAAHPGKNAFLDPLGCRAYADDATRTLDARLKQEAGGTP